MRSPQAPRKSSWTRGRLRLLAALAGVCVGSVAVGLSQPPGGQLPPPGPLPNREGADGPPAQLPSPPERPGRPAAGPGSVAEFVEGLARNDAAFEVQLGQGRILATRADLAVKGKPAPLVAIGDPTVADFS